MNLALVKKTVICSNSLSAVESLSNLYSNAALTIQIQLLFHCLLHRNFSKFIVEFLVYLVMNWQSGQQKRFHLSPKLWYRKMKQNTDLHTAY